MATLTLPRIYLGKRKPRSQMCRVYTIDGRVLKLELPVSRGCILDELNGKGFLISPANQFAKEDRLAWQIIFENSVLPIALREELNIKNLTKLIDQIYIDNHEEAQRQELRDAKKNKIWDKILWVVGMPCTVALIWGAMTIIKG